MEKRSPQGIRVCVIALLIAIGIGSILALCSYDSWPNNAIREAKALIPRIAEIRPYVEEHWVLMNNVNQVLEAHPEIRTIRDNETPVMCRMEDRQERTLSEIASLSEKEKQTITALFDGTAPFAMSLDVIHTGIYGDDRLMQIDILYISENDLNRCHEVYYYMEELAPNWYACTSVVRMVRGVDFAPYQAQREDGGLVRLPQEENREER